MSSFENFVQCRVVTPFTAAATEIGLFAADTPHRLPAEGGGVLVLTDSPYRPSALEVIRYGRRSGMALYEVSRAQEGTAARDWTGVAFCYQALTAGELERLLSEKADTSALDGLREEAETALDSKADRNQLDWISAVGLVADNPAIPYVRQASTSAVIELATREGLQATSNAMAGKLGLYDTAVAAWKTAWQDLRGVATWYGPPSSLHGKGTITGFTNGALLGIPGMSETDYGVVELSGQWTDTSGHAGAAQRVFRTSNGRQFYQHQLPTQDVWSEWYETQNVGKAARSQNRVELFSISHGGSPAGLTIYTNISVVDGSPIGTLRIVGTLSSYTSPVEMLVGWYFYNGAVYMPEALVNTAGTPPTISVGVHNGTIAVQIAFAGGSAYIPRLAIEAVNVLGDYQTAPEQLQGWSYSWALDQLSGLVACNQKNVINNQTIGQFAPSLTGYGATGTWGINISGSATWAVEAGYAASAGYAQTAGSAGWAGGAELADRLTLHGGDHCSFVWIDQGDSPMYLLGTPGSNPAEGRVFATQNLNVATARRAGTLNWTAYSGQGVGDGGHVVFDASSVLSPSGTTIGSGSVDSQYAWSDGCPTLMGWNGGATYGVRVDRARYSEGTVTDFLPITSNELSLGQSWTLFTTAHLGTAPIVTSDRDAKQDILPIDDAVLDAWATLGYMQYRLKDAVAAKGEAARTHAGLIAQDIKEAFEAAGLDPFKYGVLCYDEWEQELREHPAEYEQIEIPAEYEQIEVPAVLDDEGNEVEPARIEQGDLIQEARHEQGELIKEAWTEVVREAGSRYSVRYEEAFALECALQRRTTQRLEQRLTALEAA